MRRPPRTVGYTSIPTSCKSKLLNVFLNFPVKPSIRRMKGMQTEGGGLFVND